MKLLQLGSIYLPCLTRGYTIALVTRGCQLFRTSRGLLGHFVIIIQEKNSADLKKKLGNLNYVSLQITVE